MSYRSEFKSVESDAKWTFWRIFWFIVGVTIVCSIVGFGLTMLAKPAAIIDKVTDPDRVIFNYEWYQDTYNDCLALDKQIVNAQNQVDTLQSSLNADRSTWGREDKTEWNRLSSVVGGMRTQRDSVIADYNAKSKMLTRNLFKDRSLPYKLEVVDDKTVEAF